MSFVDEVIGFIVAVPEFDVDVVVLGFIVAVFAGFDVETGLFVVAGFEGELVLFDDDDALFVTGFVVLDEFPLLPVLLLDELLLFDATGLLPFCLGVRAWIFASSAAVM